MSELPPAPTDLQIKVCGITRRYEIDLLEALPVNFVGLWHGVWGGRAELPLADCWRLAAAAHATQTLEPVLVTFINESKALADAVATSQVRWVQLHGYQTPAVVRAVKRDAPRATRVVKVLHVRGRECLEGPLIRTYERAGVDAFLFDAAAGDGRIGSTGRSLDGEFVSAIAKQLTRPFLLAGGIGPESRRAHLTSVRNPRCLGIDVDTNARGRDGALRPEKVEAIARAWKVRAHAGAEDAE